MKKYELFNNEIIRECISEAFELPLNDYGVDTESIFFSAFFYLTKRFGSPECNKYGTSWWKFAVKEFDVEIWLKGYEVIFRIAGKYRYNIRRTFNQMAVKYYRNPTEESEKLAFRDYSNYTNSYLKFALKTLKQFLHNLLSPIEVCDEYFNIKGWVGALDGINRNDYDKMIMHKNNIKIERINNEN